MYNKNAAYDLSLFEEKQRKSNVVRLNADKLRKVKELKAKMILMTGSLLICAGVAAGIVAFISGQAQIAELTVESDRVSKQIQEQEGMCTQLEMKKKAEVLENRLSYKAEGLGMINPQNVEYINVSNKDKAVFRNEDKGINDIKNQFLRFCNNLFSI